MIHKKLWGIDLYQKKHIYDNNTRCFPCGFYKGKKKHICNCPKPLHLLKREMEGGEILFHSNYKGYRYFGKIPRDDYINLLKLNKNLFEVIDCDTARRVYFDVDGKNGKINCLEEAKKQIKKIFGDDVEMTISGSFGKKDGKDYYSYHIILNDIVFDNLEDMIKSGIKDWVKYLEVNNPECGIDISVYKNNQYFKSVNQSKNEKASVRRIQKPINEDDIEFHMVQVFKDEYEGEFINGLTFAPKMLKYKKVLDKQIKKKLKKQGKKSGATSGMMTIKELPPRFKRPDIDFEFDEPIEILMKIPNTDPLHAISSKLHYNIGNWAYHNGISYKHFLMWENRHIGKMYFEDKCSLNNPYTSKESWDKYKASKYWWRTERIQNLLECFYGKLVNKRYETFKKEFIDFGVGDVIVNQKYIERKHINNRKYQLIQVNMGGGKSYATIEYLIERYNQNPNFTFVWITNRISMAMNLMNRLNGFNDVEKNKKFPNMKRNLEAKNYKRMGCDKFERSKKIRECKRLVIELESIHYLKDIKLYNNEIQKSYFEVVVCDEIESVFNSFGNDKCHKNGDTFDDNYLTFENVIKRADKVFMMDAFLHHRTINWVKLLEPYNEFGGKNTSLIQRSPEFDNIDKNVNYHKSFYTWFNQVVEDIVNGKRCYLFYPYKTGRGSVLKLSIDGLKKRIIECVNIRAKELKKDERMSDNDVIDYHGDIDDAIKNDLTKVNEIWGKYLLVITNSCITVGVSYDLKDFDKIYLGYADLINPRDVIQSSFRIRNTKEKVIEFYYFPNIRKIIAKKNQDVFRPNAMKKPNLDCETFMMLVNENREQPFLYMRNFLSQEYNAKGLETLKAFFKATGYKNNDEFENTNDNPLLFRSGKCEEVGLWDYKSISKINDFQKSLYEMDIFEGTATMKQKLEVDKFFIECSFYENGWDNNEKIFINKKDCDSIKEWFYLNPNMLFGFRALWKFDDILNYALKFQYGEIVYNHNDLSIDDKILIENYFHLAHFGDVGTLHKKKFLKLSDYIIKKHIIKFFFGKYFIQRPTPDKKLKFSDGIVHFMLRRTNVLSKKGNRLCNPNRYYLMKDLQKHFGKNIYPQDKKVNTSRVSLKHSNDKIWSVEDYQQFKKMRKEGYGEFSEKSLNWGIYTFATKKIPFKKSKFYSLFNPKNYTILEEKDN